MGRLVGYLGLVVVALMGLGACSAPSSGVDNRISSIASFSTSGVRCYRQASEDGTVYGYQRRTTTTGVVSGNFTTVKLFQETLATDQVTVLETYTSYIVQQSDGVYGVVTTNAEPALELFYGYPLTPGVTYAVPNYPSASMLVFDYETIEVNGESHYVVQFRHSLDDGDGILRAVTYYSNQGLVRYTATADNRVTDLMDCF